MGCNSGGEKGEEKTKTDANHEITTVLQELIQEVKQLKAESQNANASALQELKKDFQVLREELKHSSELNEQLKAEIEDRKIVERELRQEIHQLKTKMDKTNKVTEDEKQQWIQESFKRLEENMKDLRTEHKGNFNTCCMTKVDNPFIVSNPDTQENVETIIKEAQTRAIFIRPYMTNSSIKKLLTETTDPTHKLAVAKIINQIRTLHRQLLSFTKGESVTEGNSTPPLESTNTEEVEESDISINSHGP